MAIHQHQKTGVRYINIEITDPNGWFGKPKGYKFSCIEQEALKLIDRGRAVDVEEEKKTKKARPANKMAKATSNK
jgi:hypothetical protein